MRKTYGQFTDLDDKKVRNMKQILASLEAPHHPWEVTGAKRTLCTQGLWVAGTVLSAGNTGTEKPGVCLHLVRTHDCGQAAVHQTTADTNAKLQRVSMGD